MSELSFHTNIGNLNLHIGKLLSQAYRKKLGIAVLSDNEDWLRGLDAFLWTQDRNSFIPHAIAGSDGDRFGAIQLSTSYTELQPCGMLVMVCQDVPRNFASILEKFPKVIDLVPSAEPGLSYGRNRYRTYRQMGLSTTVHKF